MFLVVPIRGLKPTANMRCRDATEACVAWRLIIVAVGFNPRKRFIHHLRRVATAEQAPHSKLKIQNSPFRRRRRVIGAICVLNEFTAPIRLCEPIILAFHIPNSSFQIPNSAQGDPSTPPAKKIPKNVLKPREGNLAQCRHALSAWIS